MSQIKINKLLRRAKKIENQISELKNLYSEFEEITHELRRLKFKANERAAIVDNFKKSNVAFRTTSVKRFELVLFK